MSRKISGLQHLLELVNTPTSVTALLSLSEGTFSRMSTTSSHAPPTISAFGCIVWTYSVRGLPAPFTAFSALFLIVIVCGDILAWGVHGEETGPILPTWARFNYPLTTLHKVRFERS